MWLTEAEASKKWCPHIRDIRVGAHEFQTSVATCRASECMLWRFVPLLGPADQASMIEIAAPRKGYCGLAGAPR